MSSRTGKQGFIHRGISVALGGDDRLHAKVPVGRKANGEEDRRHVSAPKGEAASIRQKIDALLDAKARHEVPRVGRAPTVETWMRHWLTEIAPYGKRPVSPKSLESYWSICQTWIFRHLGQLRLDELSVENLDAMYSAMYRRKLAGTTVLKAHAVLRRGLEMAVRRDKVRRNVAQMMDNPGSTKRRRKRAFTMAQARRVIDVIAGRPDALRWRLALAVGLRQGEVLGLRWQAVDFDAGTIAPDWQLQRQVYRHGCADPAGCAAPRCRTEPCREGCRLHRRACPPPCGPGCTGHARHCPQRVGGLVFVRAKTVDGEELGEGEEWDDEEDTHVIALPATIVDELREHRLEQSRRRLQSGAMWQGHDLVFCLDDGGKIDPRADLRTWHEILAEAGFRQTGTHLARSSAASIMHEMGEDIATIQQVLRHTDIRTTRGYLKVSAAATAAAARTMDGALFGSNVTDIVTKRRSR